MKNLVMVLMSLMLLNSLSLADDKGTGLYGGIGFGNTAFEDDHYIEKEQPQVRGTLSETALGVKLYFGYLINKIVGVELDFTDYGDFHTKDYTYKTKAASGNMNVGYSFLQGTLRPFVLLGIGYVVNDFPHFNNTPVDDNKVATHMGLGLDYTPAFAKGFGLRGAFESDTFAYRVPQDSDNSTKDYEMGLGMLYLGVHYKY